MDGLEFATAFSAGQRTGASLDYVPSDSPRASHFVDHQVPPGSSQLSTQSAINEAQAANEGGDEEESLDDSFAYGFGGSSADEYENNDMFLYEPAEEGTCEHSEGHSVGGS